MFDQTAEFRQEVATARMAALRRSAEWRPAGRRLTSIPARVIVAILVLTALTLGGRAYASDDVAAGPQPVEITFVGAQGPAAWSELGWLHAGTFTASAPFCSVGTAADVVHEYPLPDVAVRKFTCDDGSGSVSLRVGPLTAEGAFGGTGSWALVDGTGRYATLRGMGTWRTVAVDDRDDGTGPFRTSLSGIAAFDVEAPSITIQRASVTGKRGPRVLRVVFSAPDDVQANVVSYRVTTMTGGRVLDEGSGTTTAGRSVSLTQALRVPRRVRSATVVVIATDPVGNVRQLVQRILLA